MYQAGLWMFLSCILFALMGHFVKLASTDYHTFELMFYRAFGSLILISAVLLVRKISVKTLHFKAHLSRSLFGLGAMLTYFYTLTHLPVPTAITLNYTSPLFLGILSLFVLKEKSRALTWLSVILGFAGILSLLQPRFASSDWMIVLVGLGSGAMAAMAYTHIKQLGAAKEPALRVVFYFSLISATGAMLLSLSQGGFTPIKDQSYPYLIGIGLTGGFGQWLITKAYSQGNTLAMGAMGFSTIVFSSLLTAMTTGSPLHLTDYLSQALIVSAGLISIYSEEKNKNSLERSKNLTR